MLNQNLLNLSPVDVELCQIKDFSLNSAKSEILPSMFNFVIVELNNLEELINDSAYLERKFHCDAFSKTIKYSAENGFTTKDGVRLITWKPSDIIQTTFHNYDFYEGQRRFTLELRFNRFCKYLEDFKADYLAYMKNVKASQKRMLDKIGCD